MRGWSTFELEETLRIIEEGKEEKCNNGKIVSINSKKGEITSQI